MRILRLGRAEPARGVNPDPQPSLLLRNVAQDAMARQYAAGIKDGFEITLHLVLGEEYAGEGEPYRGPIPDELRTWAQAALRRIEAG